MRMLRLYFIFPLIMLIVVLSVSCRKWDKLDTSPGISLSFSTDTVFFDTVFPTVGSVTQRLVVYNDHDNKIGISTIRLAGGNGSSYRINIDGFPAISASDVEIPGHDSIYIFVRVTIDPHNENTPYVVSDSIEFTTNGTLQTVRLVAWGREAIFYRKETLEGNITWDSLRAHVIYESLRIDTNATLTIMPGTRIYFHKDAWIAFSYGSTLKSGGTLGHPVIFQGDRMDPYYKDLPGQWEGIYLEKGSRDHQVDYTWIRNGMFGLSADSPGSGQAPMLSLSNSIIQNMAGIGIYAYGSSIASVNCVVGDCGRSCFYAEFGGEYDFRQLTVGNYWFTSVRHTPSVYLSNYSYDSLGNKIPNPLSKANFANAIIYGSDDEEIGLDSITAVPFSVTFDHAILKTRMATSNQSRFIECLVNQDPRFVAPQDLDYRIDSLSPAIGKGRDLGIPFDILGNERGTTPDLGAYEYVSKK